MLKATQLAGLGRRPVTGGNDHLTKLIVSAGANGATTFTDRSNGGKFGSRHTLATVGNTVATNSAQIWGTTNFIAFDGSGDAIDCGTHADWDFADHDFTVEAWVRQISIAGSGVPGRGFLSNFDKATNSGWALWSDNANGSPAGRLFCQIGNGSTWYSASGPAGMSSGPTYHIAFVRFRDTLMVFQDGVKGANSALPSGAKMASPVRPLLIGRNPYGLDGSTSDLYGNVGEVRVSKGIARYTANFTPPTTPWKSWE